MHLYGIGMPPQIFIVAWLLKKSLAPRPGPAWRIRLAHPGKCRRRRQWWRRRRGHSSEPGRVDHHLRRPCGWHFAQSVGGGGTAGDVEMAVVSQFKNLNVGVGVNVQQAAGKGGNGGDLDISVKGPITTSGLASHGIFAHSMSASINSGRPLLMHRPGMNTASTLDRQTRPS
jgi:hypothetical protein